MEKRTLLDASDSNGTCRARPQRSSNSALKWIAGLSLFAAFSIGIVSHTSLYQAASDFVEDYSSDGFDLFVRQSSSSTSQCDDTSNCTVDLVPFTYKPLPLGSIKPLGWLKDQMQSQADGLAGHQHDFFAPVSDSRWTGGDYDYSSLNEGLPYWFNGLVPLAYGLDDERLISTVQSALATVLQLQSNTTGVLGPPNPDTGLVQSSDTWGRYPFMLGMIQMAEADSALAPAIVDSLYRWIPYMYNVLADGVDPNEVWGRARYQDAVITMQWLYENYPKYNGTDKRPLLSNTMYRLKMHGADWIGYYQEQSYIFGDLDDVNPPIGDDGSDGAFKFTHGVNVGQGLKTPSVDYRFTHNSSLLDVQRDAINWTLVYHGSSAGTIVGDERESNLSPNRGSELCTAVEAMYSMSYAYGVTGNNDYADHAELLAFNALPVMLTADNWAHQYVVQPNQPWASDVVDPSGIWWNVGNYGNTFGLAPNYPCCTVNHPQGYPKFASHMFMTVGDDGLAHVLLSPGNVTTQLGNGANVNVYTLTDYPFSDVLTYHTNSDNPFTFYVRVPGWASEPRVIVNGQAVATTLGSNSLAAISVPAGQTVIQYILQSSTRVVPRSNNTVAIYHGALLYALDVGYSATTTVGQADIVVGRAPPKSNSQVLLAYQQNPNVAINSANVPAQAKNYNISNTQSWNFAIDPATLAYFPNDTTMGESASTSAVSAYQNENLQDTASDPPALPNPIWDYQAPAQYMKARACQIDWPLNGNMPDIPPNTNDRDCLGKSVDIVLRPYGSLKVHMAELPTKVLGGSVINGTADA